MVMKPADFVARLRSAVVEENAVLYRQLFTGTPLAQASDPYWKRALTLFNGLVPEQQAIFFEVIRQIAADTTSNVLGVIDGAATLEGMNAEFELTYEGGPKLNGDLQTLFLVEEEQVSKMR